MQEALPPAALPAWAAYLAMEQSKHSHLELLRAVDLKERDGGARTLAESARLAQLLADHDLNVRRFAQAVRELRESDAEAARCLLRHLTAANLAHD